MSKRMSRYQTTMTVRMMPGCGDRNAREWLFIEAEAIEAGEITAPYMVNNDSLRDLPANVNGYWRKVAVIGKRYTVWAQRVPLMLQAGCSMYPITVRIVEIGSETERQMLEVAS
jgi:hypothetical protein